MSGAALPSRRHVAPVVVLLFLVGLPVASATPVQVDLDYIGTTQLAGAGIWRASDGALDLQVGESVPAFGLTIDAARIDVRTQEWEHRRTQVGPLFSDERRGERTETTTAFDDATITLQHLRPSARLALTGTPWDLDLHFAAGTLDNVYHMWATADPDEATMHADPDDEEAPRTLWPHSTYLQDQVLLTPDSIDYTATGDLRFTLLEGDIIVDENGQRHTFTSGVTRAASTTLEPVHEAQVTRLLIVTVYDAVVRGSWSGIAYAAATAPTIELDGVLALDSARGDVAVDSVAVRAHNDALTAEGALVLRPTVDAALGLRPYRLEDDRVHYTGGKLAASGDATAVTLDTTAIRHPFREGPDLIAAGAAGAGILAVLFSLWRFGPLALAALYSRIEQGALLDNPTRAQIYAIICANPGISARKIHQAADASWGTVVHHLSKLDAAGYISVVQRGRAKSYYENHGKWDGHQRPLALLSSRRTRQLAELVVKSPGKDQGQLVGRSGLPQSTVSYHLLKLEDEGLVSKERMGSTLVYYPTTMLRQLLERLGALPATLRVGALEEAA